MTLNLPVEMRNNNFHFRVLNDNKFDQKDKSSTIKQTFKSKKISSNRDELLEFGLMCEEFSLRHCLTDIDDIIELISEDSPIDELVLSKAFFESNESR